MEFITNPVFVSVIVMLTLCVLKCNVYLAIIASAILCGLMGGAKLLDILPLITDGIAGQGENAIIFTLLATIASIIISTGVGEALAPRVAKLLAKRPWTLLVGLVVIGACCETVITFGATFCFVILPPLLAVFNQFKIDRRKVATAIMCGLQIGYVCVPIGYGAVFQQIVSDTMSESGIELSYLEIAKSTWPILIAMILAAVAVAVVFRKPREYTPVPGVTAPAEGSETQGQEMPPWKLKYTLALLTTLITPIVQFITGNIVLGGIIAVIACLLVRVSTFKDMDTHINNGMKTICAIVFIMAVGQGYANVSKTYGDVEGLVMSVISILGPSKLVGAFAMLFLGLIVTIGIGTSWGTVPVVGVIMVPLGIELGFSPAAIAMLICAAAVLGDAGSPASDETLVPTANLNLDGQHDHIKDTCIPSFICVNLPIIIVCAICSVFM